MRRRRRVDPSWEYNAFVETLREYGDDDELAREVRALTNLVPEVLPSEARPAPPQRFTAQQRRLWYELLLEMRHTTDELAALVEAAFAPPE